jgi:antitoxin ParD1/3/4
VSVTLHEGHTRQAVFGGGSEELCVYAEVLASYLLRIDHNNGSLDSFGGAMTTVTISLPESLKSFIDEQIATKGYGNVSEYFRTLLREAQAKEEDAKLEALLIEGLTSGEDIPLSREFWSELRTEAAELARKHKARKKS